MNMALAGMAKDERQASQDATSGRGSTEEKVGFGDDQSDPSIKNRSTGRARAC